MKFVAAGLLALALIACGGDDKSGGVLGGRNPAGAPSPVTSTASTATNATPSATAARTASPGATAARTPAGDSGNRERWQTAMLDSSAALPGQYISPHPGADGVVCDTRACANAHDDRNHVNGIIPICTTSQRTAGNITNPLCYHSDPPTSGPHSNQFAQNRVYQDQVPKEQLVHSMEHAAVIIWYNTTDQDVIRTLAQITNGANQSGKFVVMSPYGGMEANTVALTAWTRLDKFPVSQFRDQRVLDFINAHSRRFNPEGF